MLIRQVHARNYRTLEDLTISFTGYYTAICGRNDSGKSNVLRTLRLLTHPVTPFDYPARVDFDEDFTKWSDASTDDAEIRVEYEIAVDRNRDTGLYSAIVKQLDLVDPTEELAPTVVLSYTRKKRAPDYSITIGDKTDSDLAAQEIVGKIRKTGCVLMHDSSGHTDPYFWPNREGLVRDFAGEDEEELEKARKSLHRSLTKLARGHRSQMEGLLGRLEQKYKVGVTLEQLNLGMVPYSLTLGDTKVEVPLTSWGSGTRNRTNILQMLFRARQVADSPAHAEKVTPVLVVEEPESFLHPSAQARFADVLQEVCSEFKVQVIATTHSPHMLSHRRPESNILLERHAVKKALRRTKLANEDESDWMRPYGEALGVTADTFAPWRGAIFPDGSSILLVEGEQDKSYLELLRDEAHGRKRLKYDGEIFAYGGCGNLENQVLVRFLRDKYEQLVVTWDLDHDHKLQKKFEVLGLERDKHFIAIGRNEAGRQKIEGLLPERIKNSVYGSNAGLLDQAQDKVNKSDQRSAESRLKTLLFEEFKRVAVPGEDYAEFYKLARKIDKAFGQAEVAAPAGKSGGSGQADAKA